MIPGSKLLHIEVESMRQTSIGKLDLKSKYFVILTLNMCLSTSACDRHVSVHLVYVDKAVMIMTSS